MSGAGRGARDGLAPVYVWELPVRLTHWLIAGSIVVLAVTGFYIGDPFLIVSGEARNRFVMGTMKAIHYWAAIVFTLCVVARIAWMFLGNTYARWHQLVPVHRQRWKKGIQVFRFYTFLGSEPPFGAGHNPLAGAAYVAVFGLYLVEILTGLVLYGAGASVDSPLRAFAGLAPLLGGFQVARWIHHVVMWLLIGFVIHHVASSLLTSVVERNGELDSIFSGYKFLDPEAVRRELEESRR